MTTTTQLITGVPSLEWCRGKDTTFIGALEAALSVTDAPYEYHTLMGHTGLAFRTRWHQADTSVRWLPFSAMGDDVESLALARAATGWELPILADMPHGSTAELLPRLLGALDAGAPALGYRRFEGLWDTGVIYGYEDGGATLLLNDYFVGYEGPLPVTPADLYPFFVLLGRRAAPLAPVEALVASLSAAVRGWRRGSADANELWHWPRYASDAQQAYGDAALVLWLMDLEEAERLSERERGTLFHVSWFHFDVLHGARSSAAAYLREGATLLGGAAREAVLAAASLYEDEQALLQTAWDRQDAFLGPWTSRHALSEWTPAVQARERQILAEIRALDTAAVGQLSQALEALGVKI